ncbi:MAG TPA: hypothetical protein VFU40_07240 [Gemmatimonadales bacterium]|nr:hypothetical protein [Gemmatimonadales bacterium]
MSRRLVGAVMPCIVAWMAAACSETNDAARDHREPGPDAVGADSGPAATARTAERQPGALKTVPSTPVRGWKGPGGQPFEVALRTSEHESGHARRFGSITLETALRTRTLDQYPCTLCHLGRSLVMQAKRVADAHQDIRPVHPDQTGSLCSTCHAASDVEQLVLESGERATLDESYRLCAQCHFTQAEAWAQGAHGKRLDGWQGRRVVMGCADCHDPHDPALRPRMPFRAPRLERPKGDNP